MDKDELFNCEIKLRNDPQRHKDRVYVGCGAGFGGDRPSAALKLLQRVKELDYLVLECLAERTLADRYKVMMSGGKGFDPRISEWMTLLLPLAVERGVCIITNMGAVDPLGAQKEVLDVACNLGLEITVSVAHEVPLAKSEYPQSSEGSTKLREGKSTYLGAAPIAYCLEKYKPHVVITSRVADAALFLAPMVYELGWNWNDYEQLAQGSLAGHLLECGCQLTGGYFMHPGDTHRDFPFEQLLDLSLPFAEVSFKGEVYVAKADGSGGVLNFSTCAEQLLYEVGDPGRYITPDLAIDLSNVNFRPISNDRVVCIGAKPSSVLFPEKLLQLVPMDCGWKGWGEISYGGPGCVRRAQAAEYLVDRENVFWRANMKRTNILDQQNHNDVDETRVQILIMEQDSKSSTPGGNHLYRKVLPPVASAAAPANKRIALYQVAHSRTGDKGNDLNFSLIPHFPTDLERLKKVVTPDWVQNVVSALLDASLFSEHKIQQSEDRLKQVRVEIYEAPGIHSLNVVVQNILDGGVNCSRRIDRHGKTVSDLILSQEVVLPP
ncbi:uncharacterized protein LOC109707748 isoform X4 [Ananas comosus]|uniref:Uncharacterized protein LOC109707748 isoform X4 n=1 Tax=Ananas comosus TaxID=4615 RepID=A0A6P5EN00_ANACO|nr:uncharacterized protein LOC109707748 isoform X4 [Ananas comosus]